MIVTACSGGTAPFTIGDVTYTDGQPTGWLVAVLAGASEIAFTPTTNTLAAGTYTARLVISSTEAGVLPVEITIVAEVTPALQTIGAEPEGVTFSGVAGGSDPFFVDLANGDYRVRPGSVAYNSGLPLPADVAAAVGLPTGAVVSRGAIRWPGM